MPVTILDPNVALIVVDLQTGIAAMAGADRIAPIVERSAALAAAFRAKDLPVVLVNVEAVAPGRTQQARPMAAFPAEFTQLLPGLNQQPSDHTVTKRTWGAFTGTDLEAYLKAEGVTQVVITGVSTSAGVESTARFAHELGFNVTLAVDAMTDTSLEAHENSVTRVFPRMAETGTTQEILDLLDKGNT